MATHVSADINRHNSCQCFFLRASHTTMVQAEDCGQVRMDDGEDGFEDGFWVLQVNPTGNAIEPFLDVYRVGKDAD